MTSFHRIVAAFAAVQLGVGLVSAQQDDNWCTDNRFNSLNASASYSVPGFTPPGDTSSTNSTWTFSTGVVTWGGGNTTQRIWLNTSPALEVDSSSLPYQGCFIGLLSLTVEALGRGPDSNGDCKPFLGDECVTALLKNANYVAGNYSARPNEELEYNKKPTKVNESAISLEYAQCVDFPISAIPSECSNSISNQYISTPSIGGRPQLFLNATEAKKSGLPEISTCPNPGNGSAASSPLFELNITTTPDAPTNITNYSTYDQWLHRVLPILVPVWSKNDNNRSNETWSDARLICMRPEEIKQDAANPIPTAATGQPSLGVREVAYSRGVAIGFISLTTALVLLGGWML